MIGPNVICWASHFFCKMPFDPKKVPWHQDASFWKLSPARTVTVWLAIDDEDAENAAMRFIPGTHVKGHSDIANTGEDSVLRLQTEGADQMGEPFSNVLKAGQVSLHADMAVPSECLPLTHWPLFGSVAEDGQGWYAKPDGDRLLISPADEDAVAPHDAWPDDMVLAEGLHRFEQMVNIPLVKPSHTWAGLRSFAPDRSPIVGFDPASEGFFWLAGQGGYGVQTAPALATLTRALATGAKAGQPDSLLAAVSPARLR